MAIPVEPEPLIVPWWALPQEQVPQEPEAAFLAGAALNSLDRLVRSQPVWTGAWRQRLALGCAVAACRLAGRTENEAALRDAWVLRPAGVSEGEAIEALGPGGSLLSAWRLLASRAPDADTSALAQVAELLGLAHDSGLEAIAGLVSRRRDSEERQPAPFVAATLAGEAMELRPDAELLAWWLADLALAKAMRWPRAVPLFMAQAFAPAFRVEEAAQSDGMRRKRTRLRPGADGFRAAFYVALAQGAADALRLAGEMSRRAARLAEVEPRLRAKGAPDAIRLLLEDDTVPGTFATKKLSRFASRRLFQRLEGLGAVRELSGRTAFRLYGL